MAWSQAGRNLTSDIELLLCFSRSCSSSSITRCSMPVPGPDGMPSPVSGFAPTDAHDPERPRNDLPPALADPGRGVHEPDGDQPRQHHLECGAAHLGPPTP